MAVIDSPISSYSDSTPQKRVITDVIDLIDPTDAPGVEALGGLDGASSKFRFVNGKSTKMEWLEDSHSALASAINDGSNINNSQVTITVDDASIFQPGHIILAESEQMWVSSISGEVLTVTRAYSGSAATHADDVAVTIVGIARLEGDDSDAVAFTDRTVGSNYTQIFHQEIKVSRTQNQISQYGIPEEFEYQSNKAVPQLMRLVEKQMYLGARKAGSATAPRAFGGLGTFVTDNTVDFASAITQANIEDGMEAAYNDGGQPDIALVSPANMQVIKNLYDSSSYLRIERQEDTIGMVIQNVMTPFGELKLVMDRWAPADRVYLLDSERAGFITYFPFTFEPLAKVGDYERGEVVGEFSLCVKMDKAHAVLTT